MSLDIIEQILEMQNNSVKKIGISAKSFLLEGKKTDQDYCCPICKQRPNSEYDSIQR